MCGTIALIHAVINGYWVFLAIKLLNNYLRIENLELADSSLKSFFDEVKDLGPEERGNKLAENEAIMAAHNEVLEDEIVNIQTNEKI